MPVRNSYYLKMIAHMILCSKNRRVPFQSAIAGLVLITFHKRSQILVKLKTSIFPLSFTDFLSLKSNHTETHDQWWWIKTKYLSLVLNIISTLPWCSSDLRLTTTWIQLHMFKLLRFTLNQLFCDWLILIDYIVHSRDSGSCRTRRRRWWWWWARWWLNRINGKYLLI